MSAPRLKWLRLMNGLFESADGRFALTRACTADGEFYWILRDFRSDLPDPVYKERTLVGGKRRAAKIAAHESKA